MEWTGIRVLVIGASRVADDPHPLLAGRTLVRLGRLDPRRDLLVVAEALEGPGRTAERLSRHRNLYTVQGYQV